MKKVKHEFLRGLASLEAGETQDVDRLSNNPELQTASWLIRQQDGFNPTPTFIENSSRRITARLQRESTHTFKQWQRRTTYFSARLRPALTAFLFAVSLYLCASIFQNTFSQAQVFLPGDRLYPVKLVSEQTQLLFNFDPAREAQLHSEFARRRALEIEELILGERFDLLQAPVRDFSLHMNQTMLLLDDLPATNQTDQIREELEAAISSHHFILNLMVQKVPYYARGNLEMVMAATNR